MNNKIVKIVRGNKYECCHTGKVYRVWELKHDKAIMSNIKNRMLEEYPNPTRLLKLLKKGI